MSILVATDFSETAERAAELGAGLARRLGDTLVLVHVVEPPTVGYPDLMIDTVALEAELRKKATQQLHGLADKLRTRGLVVDEKVLGGLSAPERISECGRETNARLIVVGTHGRKAAARFFLGSVAERVVLSADRPVLVVRPMASSAPIEDWVSGQRPLRVMVALDRSAPSVAAVDWVRGLRSAVPCDVSFVHLYWPPAEYHRLGLTGDRSLTEPDPAVTRVIEHEFSPLLGDLPGQGRTALRVLPNWGDLGSHLASLAAEADADVLVMGTHRRHGLKRLWLGATTQPTLHAATVPVLCVSAPAAEAQTHAVPEIRSVLALTDFSPLGNAAVAHAYSLVGRGGVVHLCTVHERPLPVPAYAYEDHTGSILGTKAEDELKHKLQGLAPAEASLRGIKSMPLVVEGNQVASTVLATAARLGVDAICLSSHGRSGVAKALMGSVATAILERADRPVYVVRRPSE